MTPLANRTAVVPVGVIIIAVTTKVMPSKASTSGKGGRGVALGHRLKAGLRMDKMCHPLTLNGSIATLKSDSNGISEKLLDNQLGGTSKFTVANTGRYTTNELPEAIPHGARSFQHQRDKGGRLNNGEFSVLFTFLLLAFPSGSKRASGSPGSQG